VEPDVVPAAPSRAGAPNAATPNAVLGLLSFGEELSGYDLKKWADHSLRFFFWSPAISQIYSELRRLESLGYVTSRVVAKDDTRSRRLYRITEEGRQWLAHWLVSEPADVPVLKHPTILRVWLGHLMEPTALREAVTEHRSRLEAQLEEVRQDRRVVAANESMAYAELVIRWAERYYGAELENTNRLLDDLDDLDARTARR
jgi:DNA-binding PadR family transcriptional regulator